MSTLPDLEAIKEQTTARDLRAVQLCPDEAPPAKELEGLLTGGVEKKIVGIRVYRGSTQCWVCEELVLDRVYILPGGKKLTTLSVHGYQNPCYVPPNEGEIDGEKAVQILREVLCIDK